MTPKTKYSIVSILAIGIASVGLISTTFSDNETQPLSKPVQTFEPTKTYVDSLYLAEHIPLEYQKSVASDIVKGTIVSKSTIVEYRDVEGNYLKKGDSSVVVIEPFTVYELTAENSIKLTDDAKTTYTFKTLGGEHNGNTVITDVPELNVGDDVIVILSEAYDGKHQELQTGVFSVFKIQDKMAVGERQTISEKDLLDSLK